MSQSGLEHPKQRQRFLNPLLYALFQYPSPSSRVKEVRHTFSKSNGYTIIVPDTEVLEWSIDRDSALPFRDLCLQDDFLLSHVINTPTTLRSHERSRYFGTLNGKTVIVKDGSVFTLKGFKVFGRAHIKREYIFNPGQDYLPLDCQFVVYEVDNPLMGIPIPSKEVSPTLPKFDLVYSFREHKSKSSNLKSSASGLMSSFSSNSRVETKGSPPLSYSSGSGTEDPLTKDSYERELQRGLDLEKLLSKYPLLHRHVFSSLLALIESFDCSNANTEEDVYNCFDKTVESAFDIFQSGDPTSVNALASDFDLTGQDIADLIHRFIEKNLHEQLFSTLVFIRKNSDSELYKELQNLKNIDIGQVGLPFKSHQAFFRTERSVWAAIEQMKKLPKAKNADKKVHILLDVVHVLGGSASSTTRNCYANNSDGSSDAPDSSVSVKSTELKSTIEQSTIEKSTISNSVGSREEISIDHKDSNVTVVNADSLVSLLILVIVRSGLEYLDTELHYIRNFSSLDVESGQLGYTLLSFEGVVYHICHDSAKLAELSSRNNSLWSTISSHDYGEFVSFLQNLIETCPDWKSVLASRNNCGESFLVMTVQARRLHILRKAFEYQSIFPLSFIFYDISECGKSLLIYALETEEQDLIEEVLSKISKMSAELQRQYFDITDSWGRTVAHYFFHSFWLMKKIGKYVNWNAKDRNGQTPLFALCRCYDHPQYGELLKDGFDTWNSAAEISDEKLRTIDIMDHVDNKGNSLLHIVKDNNSVKRILLYDTDINWPNEKGLTPLMLFSKFSRIGALSLLTEDIRLDLNRREVRGFTALELAKDPSTTAYLEEDGERVTKISRTLFNDGELYFVVCSGVKPNSSSITCVKRSYSDFLFLQKWLAYENPYSWVPVLKGYRSPLSVPLRPSRQIVRETCSRLNAFIRALILHPTFSNHELLWEFLLVQDMSQQHCIERCRRKLENKRELQYEDYMIYNSEDLELIEVFFVHALRETRLLQSQLTKVVRSLIQLQNKNLDYIDIYKIFDKKLQQLEFFKPFSVVMSPHFELTYRIFDNGLEDLVSDMISTAATSNVVISALIQPLNLIQQLKAQELSLRRGRTTLSKLSNKNSWPMGMFEDKRQRDIKQTEDSIYITQNEIERLSNDIKYDHVTLAVELGGFHQSQEKEVFRAIRAFTVTKIQAEKERLQRLLRLQRNFQKI